MKVRMLVEISGTHDGVQWPPAGAVVDLADNEALSYIKAGMAAPVTSYRETERAIVDVVDVETRTEAPTVVEQAPPRPAPPRTAKDIRGAGRR